MAVPRSGAAYFVPTDILAVDCFTIDEGRTDMEYPLPAGEGMEDGGFEIEIVLDEAPARNVFEFDIEGADELDFFYQPPLTDEEVADGAVRPENVVGSYAVYHKSKANYRVGDTNYATGKG